MPDVNQQLEELITQVRARHDELYRQVEPGPWSEVEPLMAARLEYLERVAQSAGHDQAPRRPQRSERRG